MTQPAVQRVRGEDKKSEPSITERHAALAVLLLSAACSTSLPFSPHGPGRAAAVIEARTWGALSGVASFTEVPGGLQIAIDLLDAPPGLHAVHIHEFGDCGTVDARSTGGDFNPDLKSHGAPLSADAHAGDFGNILISPAGQGHLELFSPILTVRPGRYSVVGRSIVVHQFEDDFTTQPGGNAGGRIGCGEILED